jgi:hypothetical protein
MAAKDKTDLLQSTLDMLILKALSLGPMRLWRRPAHHAAES